MNSRGLFHREREKRGILARMKILPRAKEFNQHLIVSGLRLIYTCIDPLTVIPTHPTFVSVETPNNSVPENRPVGSMWVSCVHLNVGKRKTLAVEIMLIQ